MAVTRLVVLLLLLSLNANRICKGSLADDGADDKYTDCHSDSQVFKEWQKSGHANSLKTLLTASNTDWTCLKCHSDDYERVRETVRNTFWESVDDMPTVRSASNPVSCSACHRHDSDMKNNLTKPVDRICNTCHVLRCGG